MHRPGHWQLRSAVGALAGTLALGAFTAVAPTMAAQASTGPVSTTPASNTPQLAPTGTTEQIRQIVQCGNTMYAVGKFTSISQGGGSPVTRNNVFSFSANAPYTINSWNPNVNGTVNTIAVTGDCSSAFIGGHFTQVHGTPVKDLAKISAGPTSNGAVVTSFGHNAQAQVETMLLTNGHLLTGGDFTSINGSARSYYASLNVNTGKNDGYLALNISGHYSYPGVSPNPTRIYNQQLSPTGSKVLVEGDFTSVAGQSRQQIFMIDLGSGSATLDSWHPSIFNDNCSVKEPFYLQDAAWVPDASTIFAVGTGLHLNNWNGTFPLTGPCDAVTAVSATSGAVQWQNWTGCDSLFSVAADSTTVYVAGHERWADNANACNKAGNGAVRSKGMGGFDITHGIASTSILKNSAGTAGRYSRARGLGADDMLRTSAGLWIASDNQLNVDKCQGVTGHAGLCFLPN
jgi:hypothetical protein